MQHLTAAQAYFDSVTDPHDVDPVILMDGFAREQVKAVLAEIRRNVDAMHAEIFDTQFQNGHHWAQHKMYEFIDRLEETK